MFSYLFLIISVMGTFSCKWETRIVNDPMATWAQQTGASYIGYEGYKVNRNNTKEKNKPKNMFFGYSVLVKTYTGKGHKNTAASDFDTLSRIYNISHLWVKSLPDKTIIYRGQFPTKTSFQANQALSQMANININEKFPFRNAKIVSLGGNTAVNSELAKYDLRNIEGGYSFQVGVFTDSLTDHRKYAEQWTQELRKEGYEAYFYHARFESSVTIGVYTEKEALVDVYSKAAISPDRYTKRILDLQRKFPLNLINGHEAHTNSDKKTKLQSFLVEIPSF